MTVWLRRLSIAAFVLAILCALLLALMREVQMKRLDRDEKSIATANAALASFGTLRYHAAQLRSLEASYALTGNNALLESYKKSVDLVSWEIKNLESQRAVSEGVARHLPTIANRSEAIVKHGGALIDLAKQTDFATAGSFAAEHIAKRLEEEYIGLLYRAELDLLAERDARRQSFATNMGLLGEWPLILKIAAVALGLLGVALAVAPGAVAPREASAELVLESQDNVTRLPTRQYLRVALQRATTAAQKNGTFMAVVLADIVSFRKVNERFGFDLGDQLLRKLADRALRQIRQGDTVARMPGDEFAVIVFRSSRAELEDFVSGLQAELQRPCRLGEEAVRVHVCVGAGFAPDDSKDAEKLLELAAERLKEAQKTTKRGIKVFRRVTGEHTSQLELGGPVSVDGPRSPEDVDRPRASARAAMAASAVAAGAAALAKSAAASARENVTPEMASGPTVVEPVATPTAVPAAAPAASHNDTQSTKAFPGIADLLADVQKTQPNNEPLLPPAPAAPTGQAARSSEPSSADIKAIYEAELLRYLGDGAGASTEAPPAAPAPTAAEQPPAAEFAASTAAPLFNSAVDVMPPLEYSKPPATPLVTHESSVPTHSEIGDIETMAGPAGGGATDVPPLIFDPAPRLPDAADRAEALLSKVAEATSQVPTTFDPEKTIVLPPRKPSVG